MCVNSAQDVVTTMDLVTFFIAVAGFALSVYNFIESLYKNSKRLSVSVKYLCNYDDFAVMLVEFTNHSHLGISITSGKLINTLHECIVFGETRYTLFRYNDPDAAGKPIERAVIFPVYIDPLRSERVLFQTEGTLSESSCSYKIVLGSSRGKISKTLVLPTAHDDFVSLLEHLK